MNWFKSLVIAVFIFACSTIAPTPLLMEELVEQNNQVVALYYDCSEGANYVPTKEGCNPEVLEQQVLTTMDLAKEFVSADIKQPQGYDVYLATAMINFRIGMRNTIEYTEAERIARQFFEVQKASSGQSITAARFYWAAIMAAHTAWQLFNDVPALNSERKAELLLCINEGFTALSHIEEGPRKVRLVEYLTLMQHVADLIE